MSPWLHALACVVVPALWGVAMFYAFGAFDHRRERDSKSDAARLPPADYSI